jgi:hypothetical protein
MRCLARLRVSETCSTRLTRCVPRNLNTEGDREKEKYGKKRGGGFWYLGVPPPPPPPAPAPRLRQAWDHSRRLRCLGPAEILRGRLRFS